jgi:peptidoglycan LD-endopeptidase CwlK
MSKFKYGKRSLLNLGSCHTDLEQIFCLALSLDLMDITIVTGYRSSADQHKAFLEGKSKVDADDPKAKHNQIPALAVDAAPYINGKVSWNKLHCCVLAGIVLACAVMLKIGIRWGGNWDMDSEPITDQDFQDLVHFELVKGV